MPVASKKEVLLNMSNIHSGGALQVAISFVTELSKSDFDTFRSFDLLLSSEVYSSLPGDVVDFFGSTIVVYDSNGFKSIFSILNFMQLRYKVVFTLFGPKYTFIKSKVDIQGFAQSWIVNFDNPVSSNLGFFKRSILRAKYFIQSLFFSRADHLVVELEHVNKSLRNNRFLKKLNVSVVHNAISNIYLDSNAWQSVDFDVDKNKISLGFVSRDYIHKNIGILPSVAKKLLSDYGLDVCFYLTLTNEEWAKYADHFSSHGKAVGSLTVFQCPSFYQKMDAVIFPSLLECFSATPLESLVMKKPLFASDRGFVRDICSDFAFYFNPLCPDDIAKVIAEYFNASSKSKIDFDAARSHALSFSNSTQRADNYLKIINNELRN